MTVPANIKLEIAVNAGTPTAGPQNVAFSDVLTLSADDDTGVNKYLFEIVEYPDGFTLPAGWTLNTSSGSYYSTAQSPPTVTMPASSTWGKWFFRLIVDGGLRSGESAPDLIDEQTAVQILSPINSLFDLGAREIQQFHPTDLPKEGWATDQKANLRIIEANITGIGGTQDLESVLTVGPATVSQNLVVSAGTSLVLGSVTTPTDLLVGPNNTTLLAGESSTPGTHIDLIRVTAGNQPAFGESGREFFTYGTEIRPGGLTTIGQHIEWSNTIANDVLVGIEGRASGAAFNLTISGGDTADAALAAGDLRLAAGNNTLAGADGQVEWWVGGVRKGALDVNGANPAIRFDGDQGTASDIIVEQHTTADGKPLRLFAGDATSGNGGNIEYTAGIASGGNDGVHFFKSGGVEVFTAEVGGGGGRLSRTGDLLVQAWTFPVLNVDTFDLPDTNGAAGSVLTDVAGNGTLTMVVPSVLSVIGNTTDDDIRGCLDVSTVSGVVTVEADNQVIDFSGKHITAYGVAAGNAPITVGNGIDGVFFGYHAGFSAAAANRLTCIGAFAGDAAVDSDDCTFIGAKAGILATGDDNLCIGANSGDLITTGFNNMTIGSGIQVVTATANNQLNIGDVITGDMAPATRRIRIGSDPTTPVSGSVSLRLGSTIHAFQTNLLTTTARNALTEEDGMFFYNTTEDAFQARADGRWLNLGDPAKLDFATSTNTAALGDPAQIYACTDSSSPRTLTLSTSTIEKGTPTKPIWITVKDEAAEAGTNNITIATEGSQTIHGSSTYLLTTNAEAVTMYSDGSNLYLVSKIAFT